MAVELVRGIVRGAAVRGDDGALYGSPLWSFGYSPTEGEAVMLFVQGGLAYVQGPAAGVPRPETGTVAGAAVSGRIPVTAGSVTYQARYVGTAPSVSALVMLAWRGSSPWIVGVAAAASAGSSSTTNDPAPPPNATSGTLSVPAVDSGSWRSIDGWGSASSRPSTIPLDSVVQGTYSAGAYSGAWFYGSRATQLAGATISAARLRVGARLPIGSSGSSLAAHVYIHSNPSRPSGDVSRILGPYDFTLSAGFGGDWVGTLPGAAHAPLVAGGGIALYGAPYMGVRGIGSDAASGQVDFDWTR